MAALRQRLVRQRDKDWKERFREDLLDVVDKKRLNGTGALGENGPSGIGDLKILGNDIGVGQDGGMRPGAIGVDYDRK